ncbi:hypothetical protein CP532_5164 [Ophiocordyceps camponoti-leonardi (nom. inval.)]|nr:hypothetical protein CP532_5164 [Ophiocordyceps camponoti-leonardi (nom. inval.)]
MRRLALTKIQEKRTLQSRQTLSYREPELVESSDPTPQGACLYAREKAEAHNVTLPAPSNPSDVIEAQEAVPRKEYEPLRSPTPKQQGQSLQANDDTEADSSWDQSPLNGQDALAAQEASALTGWPCSEQDEDVVEPAEEPTWESLLHKVPQHPLAAFAVQQRCPSVKPGSKSWSISDLDHDGARGAETVKPAARGAGQSDDRIMPSKCLMQQWLDDSDSYPFFGWSEVTRDARKERDVSTGELLPAIQQEETLRAEQVGGPCDTPKDMAWRQMNMSSELHITREIGSRKKLAVRIKAHANERSSLRQAAAVVETAEMSRFPKAQCTIRPARNEDLDRIVEIFELERNHDGCRQVFRADRFLAEDIRDIFRGCREDKRPFLVATPNSTEAELMDRSKWPRQSDAVYQKYLEFVRASRKDEPQPVVGFAYLYDMNMGHGHCLETRHSAYMRVLVDPGHRKQSYGTALMDRMLLSSSALHVSLIDYRWDCPRPAKIYEHPVTWNERQFARIYMEVFCESGAVAEQEWRAKMLTQFNFKEVARLREALRSQRSDKAWLDMMIWEFEAQLPDNL